MRPEGYAMTLFRLSVLLMLLLASIAPARAEDPSPAEVEKIQKIVRDYLKQHPVDEHSPEPYISFSEAQYTRNLIFKNYLFELIALCWNAGQASNVHNHAGQNCWMTIPVGRIRVQNFSVLEQDFETGYCRIEPTESMDIDS